MNRFIALLLLLACSFVAQAANPAYNTSTGVVSPNQFLKLDAAELKVMGVDVLTSVPAATTIYNGNGTLSGNRIVNGGGNLLTFTNLSDFNIFGVLNVSPTGLITISDPASSSASGLYVESGPMGTTSASIYPGFFDGYVGGEQGWYFDPGAPDGSTTFKFNATTTHTSGNLLEVKNNGTNVFVVNNLGEVTSPNVNATQTGTHASPSTANPLALSWSGPLHTVWYGATGELDLPATAAYAGKALLVYNTGAFTITIDPNGSEVIVRDGTVQTGGVTMTLSSGAGNYVTLFCDGVRWVTLGYKGTLAAGS